MKLTFAQIKKVTLNPSSARTGVEKRLANLLSGDGKACTGAEKYVLALALDIKGKSLAKREFTPRSKISLRNIASKKPEPRRFKKSSSTRPERPVSKRSGLIDPGLLAARRLDERRKKTKAWIRSRPVKVTGPFRQPDYRRYIDEGIAGNREDNKRTRINNARDSLRRNN